MSCELATFSWLEGPPDRAFKVAQHNTCHLDGLLLQEVMRSIFYFEELVLVKIPFHDLLSCTLRLDKVLVAKCHRNRDLLGRDSAKSVIAQHRVDCQAWWTRHRELGDIYRSANAEGNTSILLHSLRVGDITAAFDQRLAEHFAKLTERKTLNAAWQIVNDLERVLPVLILSIAMLDARLSESLPRVFRIRELGCINALSEWLHEGW